MKTLKNPSDPKFEIGWVQADILPTGAPEVYSMYAVCSFSFSPNYIKLNMNTVLDNFYVYYLKIMIGQKSCQVPNEMYLMNDNIIFFKTFFDY